MSTDTDFETFKKTLEDLMASLPDDEHRARMTTVLSTLSERIDDTVVTKAVIRKSAREQLLDVLDKLSAQHGEAGLIQKALRDADETQAERAYRNESDAPPGVDAEYLALRDMVQKAIKKAAFNVPQIAPLNQYEQRAREVRKEIREEQADSTAPDSLRKSAASDLAVTLAANMREYRAFILSNTPASEQVDVARRLDAQIKEYLAWAASEAK